MIQIIYRKNQVAEGEGMKPVAVGIVAKNEFAIICCKFESVSALGIE